MKGFLIRMQNSKRLKQVMVFVIAFAMVFSMLSANTLVVRAVGAETDFGVLEFQNGTKVADSNAVSFTVDEKVYVVTLSAVDGAEWGVHNDNAEWRNVPAGTSVTFTLAMPEGETAVPSINISGAREEFELNEGVYSFTKMFGFGEQNFYNIQLQAGGQQGAGPSGDGDFGSFEFQGGTKVADSNAVSFTINEKVYVVTLSAVDGTEWGVHNENAEWRNIPAGTSVTFTLTMPEGETTVPSMNVGGARENFALNDGVYAFTRMFGFGEQNFYNIQLQGEGEQGPGTDPGSGETMPDHYAESGYVSIDTRNDVSGKISYAFATSVDAIMAGDWNVLTIENNNYSPIDISVMKSGEKLFFCIEANNGKHLDVDSGFIMLSETGSGRRKLMRINGTYNNDPNYNSEVEGAQPAGIGLIDLYDNTNDRYIISFDCTGHKETALFAEFGWTNVKSISVSVDAASQYMLSNEKAEIRIATGKGFATKVEDGNKVSIPLLQDIDFGGNEERYLVDLKINPEYFIPQFSFNGKNYNTFDANSGTAEYTLVAAAIPAAEFKTLIEAGKLVIHLTVDKTVGVTDASGNESDVQADFRMIDDGDIPEDISVEELDAEIQLKAEGAVVEEGFLDAYDITMEIEARPQTEFPVSINISLPGDYPNDGQFKVVREHEGEATQELDCEVVDGHIIFKTDKFSKFSVKYADDHNYGDPIISWSDDFSKAVGTFTCDRAGCTHKENVNATITSVTKDGFTTYTATVIFGGKTFKDVKVLVETEDDITRIVIEIGINEIPDSLIEKGLDTEEKIFEKLLNTVTEKTEGYTSGKSEIMDVVFQMSTDHGTAWVVVTPDNFPAEGLVVTIPYPEGTNADDYDFVITHMVTVALNGMNPGDVEMPAVTKTAKGIQFTVKSLSPIGISWKALEGTPDPGNGDIDTGSSDNRAWIVALLASLGVFATLVSIKRKREEME